MDAQHIPAWRRLWLKLKFANEDVPDARPSGGVEKRKQETSIDGTNGIDIQPRQLKKRRIDGKVPERQLNEKTQVSGHNVSETSLPRRKKSVTFTPDTKAEDGDSVQTTQLSVPDSPGSTPKKRDSAIYTSQTMESDQKPKKEKKLKTPRGSSTEAPPRKATAALNYLNQYCFQRSAWKFNKNHETWILKHSLSTDQIPIEQSLPLASYLMGLKSPGARQRLVEQSRQALKSEESIDGGDSEIREKIQEALGEENIHDEAGSETPAWLMGISRAKLILVCLGESSNPTRGRLPTNGQPNPRTKKNKSRTTRIEVDSSSSSESEDEGNDSESSGSDIANLAHEGKKTGLSSTDVIHSTSSSGSSSDSSDSSDDTSEGTSDTSSEGGSDGE